MFKKVLLAFVVLALCLFFSGQTALAAKDNVRLKVFIHSPRPHGKPVAVDTCSITSGDQVNDWAWAGWTMPVGGLSYKINYNSKPKNLTNDQMFNGISAGFATWTSTDNNQIFNYSGTTTAKNAKLDNTNAVLFKRIQPNAIAITYIWYYSGGPVVEVDTIFNSAYKWSLTAYDGTNDCGGVSGTYDLQNIATHEFGHWIGLDDLYSNVDQDLTMYGYGETKELKKDSLGLGDITGVLAIAP